MILYAYQKLTWILEFLVTIDIEGYKLVRSDHPDNIKRGGVCIYYKESLPVRVINLPFFKEALLLEMCYNKKKCLCP